MMRITEEALIKLMSGEDLTEIERADIENALQKREEQKAKKKANEELRNDIVKALREYSPCPKTTTEIKSTLCRYDCHKYESVSENKICKAMYFLYNDRESNVRTAQITVVTPFTKSKRVAFYI